MAWTSSVHLPFEVALWICLIFGTLDSALSQDQQPACLLLDRGVDVIGVSAFISVATRNITEAEPEIAVLVDFDRQARFTQFTLQAWSMLGALLVKPIGSWYPPIDTNFQVASCSSGVGNTVTFAPNLNQLPEPGMNRFTWLSPNTQANETTVFFRVVALNENNEAVEYRSRIIQLDFRPPDILNCPADIFVTVPFDHGDTITLTWTPPQSVDNTGTPSLLSFSHQPGEAFTVGRRVDVTYVFADDTGLRSECRFKVAVAREGDLVPPNIFCPGNIERIVTDFSVSGIRLSWSLPTATDNSDNAPTIVLTSNPQQDNNSYFSFGNYSITYAAYDESLNENSCSFIVKIVDGAPPMWTVCPADISVEVSQGNSNGAEVSWNLPVAIDNDGFTPTVELTSDRQLGPGSFFLFGTHSITYVATDRSGNENMCTFNVAVVDNVPPEVVCPADLSYQILYGSRGRHVFWSEPTFFDNSGSVSLVSQSHNSNDLFSPGQTDVTYVYRDQADNRNQCSFTITITEAVCSPNPCFNGGSCNPTNDGFTCTCVSGFTGRQCVTTVIAACSSSPCRNGGTCLQSDQDYTCLCLPGYSGNRCQNYNDAQDSSDFICHCPQGTAGRNCDIGPCNPSPCLNGATCALVQGGVTCSCLTGYYGRFCQFSPCTNDPCMNGGTCIVSGDTYQCQCVPSFSGDICQLRMDCLSSPCVNDGICFQSHNSEGEYFCNCSSAFTGVNCQDRDIAAPLVTCPQNIIVSDWPASATYFSVQWDEPTATDELSEPVRLINQTHRSGVELPVQQITTVAYSYRDAVGNVGSCSFQITFARENCASNPCANGKCVDFSGNFQCYCLAGWTGDRCQEDIDECASNPCQDGSTCFNQINGYMCFCGNGSAGRECETELDACPSNMCLNDGLCFKRPGTECNCNMDSSGTMNGCEVSVDCDVNGILEALTQVVVDETNVLSVSAELRNVTSNLSNETLEGDELSLTATVLENIGSVINSSLEVTVNVIETVDNVLMLPNEVFEASGDSPGRILRTFETQLTNVKENLTMPGKLSSRAVDVVVFRPDLDTNFASGLSYASISTGGVIDETLQNNEVQLSSAIEPRDDAEAFIGLPGEALVVASDQDPSAKLPIVFAVYLTSKLFQPATPESLSFPDGRQLSVNSAIISAIIGDPDVEIPNLVNPVVTSFIPSNQTLAGEQICVFWDVAARNWSTEGCTRSTVNPGQHSVACDCNHLTNFAILLSYYGDIDSYALDIISKVGCAISIAALVLTILTSLVLRELRNNPGKKSLINLCVSLLALYVFFLAGIDRAQSPVTCVIMAALIHYFFLTSVCWASAEALNLFYLLVLTRRGLLTKYLLRLMLFCWGVPLIIVVITYLVTYLGTGKLQFEHGYCFLPPGTTLYIAVPLPVGLLLLFNIFIFILLVRRLTCKRIESTLTRDETHVQAAIRHGRLMLPMSMLLGATWLVGFLAIEGATYVFQWIFAVLNSLLGLSIFLLFIAGKKTGRKGLGKLFCFDKIRKITSSHTSSNQLIRANSPQVASSS
ncbi:adhesion G protein-coupled receptor E1-like [Patiria miniata]|uniref:Uncharacterized protein n=1 Tax=Patiria miniata TaxID=46514 RepID=A0A914BQJ9_PATMI|nr:adhesion G protein-coupled receptor E1-like [Patiria miniata]